MAKRTVVTQAHLTKMKVAVKSALAKSAPEGSVSLPPVTKMMSLGGGGVNPRPKIIVIVTITVIVVPDA